MSDMGDYPMEKHRAGSVRGILSCTITNERLARRGYFSISEAYKSLHAVSLNRRVPIGHARRCESLASRFMSVSHSIERESDAFSKKARSVSPKEQETTGIFVPVVKAVASAFSGISAKPTQHRPTESVPKADRPPRNSPSFQRGDPCRRVHGSSPPQVLR